MNFKIIKCTGSALSAKRKCDNFLSYSSVGDVMSVIVQDGGPIKMSTI